LACIDERDNTKPPMQVTETTSLVAVIPVTDEEQQASVGDEQAADAEAEPPIDKAPVKASRRGSRVTVTRAFATVKTARATTRAWLYRLATTNAYHEELLNSYKVRALRMNDQGPCWPRLTAATSWH
jgi:hypothetical protein